jgi:dihydrofolate reductase
MSMSLDGFITGPNPAPDNPLGTNGQHLHDWFFENPDSAYNRNLDDFMKNKLGAIIMGRVMYEESIPQWNGTGPAGDGVPCFVLTEKGAEPPEAAKVFTFVTGGIKEALSEAKAVSDGKDILINGGADTIRQFIKAGLADSLHIHLVPILLGGGTSFFHTFGEYVKLEKTEVIDEDYATHMAYKLK